MDEKNTIVYIGFDNIIPKALGNNEEYLVNSVNPNNLTHISEYIKPDAEVKDVARDTLEGDASLIIMDTKMLDGVTNFSDKIDKIIELKLKGESLDEFNDEMSQAIKRAIDLSEDKLGKISNNKFEDLINKKEYLEYVKLIMNSIGSRVILGDKKFDFIKNYIEQMKSEAEKRRKDSRFNTGDQRDLVEDTDEHWKPSFIMTSTEELPQITNNKNVRLEYQRQYLMQNLINGLGIDVDIPLPINVRAEYDVKLEDSVLKGITETIKKVKELVSQKLKGVIDLTDPLAKSVNSLIDSFGKDIPNENEIVEKIVKNIDMTDMIDLANIEKIISAVSRLEKNCILGNKDTSNPKEVQYKPRLLINEHDEELDNIELNVIKNFLEKAGIKTEEFEMVADNYSRTFIDSKKVISTLEWIELFQNPENQKSAKIDEVLSKAMGMVGALDVDGSILGHSLRTALLMKDFLTYMTKANWKAVENIIPQQSAYRYQIPKGEINYMTMGAFLHDNGKVLNILQPELIPFLPSLQTNASWGLPDSAQASIKNHAEIGAQNIQYIKEHFAGNKSELKYAYDMAFYHQEFVNDNGQEKKGYSKDGKHYDAQVPLAAQYMAIVDVFDAIVSNRNYNKKTTLEEAIGILASQGGIKILQEVEDDKGKYALADSKRWKMDSNIKFEIEEGAISRETLHFNPVLLKFFCEYMQDQVLKAKENNYSFVKFENDELASSKRKVISGIGSRDFSKVVVHETIDKKEWESIRGTEEERMSIKVEEFKRIFKSLKELSRTVNSEKRDAIINELYEYREEILSEVKTMGGRFAKKILKELGGLDKSEKNIFER